MSADEVKKETAYETCEAVEYYIDVERVSMVHFFVSYLQLHKEER